LQSIVDSFLKTLRTSSFYEAARKNKLLRIIKNNYDKMQYKSKSNSLKEHGLKALVLMKEAFEEIDKEYWLDYGTLLGAVREKDFISHDKDLDIGTFDFDDELKLKLEHILRGKGFKKYKQYEMGGKIIEESYHYKGVHFDIFYYHWEDNNKIWCYFCEIGPNMSFENYPNYQLAKGYITKKVTSRFEGLTEYEFKGEKFFIPANYHDYLVDNYGEGYMQVIKDWQSGSSPTNISLVETNDVVVKEYI
jgi:hypothetical protein